MFDFEEDEAKKIEPVANDAYDVELAIAISRSFVHAPGSQILSPEDVQKMIKQKLLGLISKNDA